MIESDLEKRKKKQKKLRVYYIILAVLIALELGIAGYYYYQIQYLPNKPVELPLGEAVTMSKVGTFSDMEYNNSQITLTIGEGIKNLQATDMDKKPISLNEGQKITVKNDWLNLNGLKTLGFINPPNYKQVPDVMDWGELARMLLPLFLIVTFIYLMFFSNVLEGGFKQFRKDKNSITFADVGGLAEAKLSLMEAASFIIDRKYLIKTGAKIPKGILLTGEPGVGKTMLARAMATETGIGFHYATGSEFHSYFVAMAAKKVKKLFNKARRFPSIIFIDEFDSLGQRRSFRGTDMATDNEHTLNQLLAEMDGFTKDTQVLVIAATNHPEVLDPALLRAGRFDRRIDVGLPTFKERQEILQIHAKGKPLATSVSIENLAKQTGGMTGADLAGVLNEAAIRAGRNHKSEIEMSDLVNAIDAVVAGAERKALILTDKEKRLVAYHEAGHALVASLLPECEKVQRISILPHGVAGGFTRLSTEQETALLSKTKALSMISMMLGGRVAEELVIGDISSGAQNDIQRANQIATEMVRHMGMGEKYGLRYLGQQVNPMFGGNGDISTEALNTIEGDVSNILNECYGVAKGLIGGKKNILDKLADRLIEVETLDVDEINGIIGGS